MVKLPPPLSWLWSAWLLFGQVLGKIMSKIILTVLWIVGFGIYGIIHRILCLFTKKKADAATYWIDVPPVKPGDLHRQF